MTGERTGLTRRDTLKAGGAGVVLTLSGSTAGCLSLLPPVGQEVRYGRVDTPGPFGGPAYRNWMPAADELPDGLDASVSDLRWMTVTPGALGRDDLGTEFRTGASVVTATVDYYGYEFEHFEHGFALGPLGTVLTGDVEHGTVEVTLADTGYEREGTYQGYGLYDRADQPRTVAVGEDAIVQTHGEDRRVLAETLVDTRAGRIDRRHDRDETFAEFSEWVGTYPTLLEGFGGGLGDTPPAEAAMAYTFDDEAGYFVYFQQYEAGETPSKAELQQALEDAQQRAIRAWSVDIEIEGTQVAVQMRIEKDEFGSDFVDDRKPLATWGVDVDDDAATVHHEAGEPVPVDQLEIDQPEALDTRLDELGNQFEAGDSLTFDATALEAGEGRLALFYRFAGTEHDRAALFTHDLDESET